MLVYLVSFVVYAIIFMIGMFFIYKNHENIESIIPKVVAVGFVFQILINWLFWGDTSAFEMIDVLAQMERNALNFMLLSLISIFCYSALFVFLIKTNEYFHD